MKKHLEDKFHDISPRFLIYARFTSFAELYNLRAFDCYSGIKIIFERVKYEKIK